MNPILHYSFDLWLTLIRSNPVFKEQRARYFHYHYNVPDKTLDEVKAAFRQVDLMCNAINEKTGGNIDAVEMYLMVIHLINEGQLSYAAIDTADLYRQMDELLFRYPPELYSADTLRTLSALRERPGVTCNILSNTGFIRGTTLRRVLEALELAPFFDFQLYSDEAEMSKPNPRFFRELLLRAERVQGRPLPLESIVHVGDNAFADISGAAAVGLRGVLINSNDLTITSLISF